MEQNWIVRLILLTFGLLISCIEKLSSIPMFILNGMRDMWCRTVNKSTLYLSSIFQMELYDDICTILRLVWSGLAILRTLFTSYFQLPTWLLGVTSAPGLCCLSNAAEQTLSRMWQLDKCWHPNQEITIIKSDFCSVRCIKFVLVLSGLRMTDRCVECTWFSSQVLGSI